MGGDGKLHVPDWKQYKIDGIKELETLKRLLAIKGLKDPWIRNEVWRYHPSHYSGVGKEAAKSLLRGFRWAFPAVIMTIIAKKAFSPATDH